MEGCRVPAPRRIRDCPDGLITTPSVSVKPDHAQPDQGLVARW